MTRRLGMAVMLFAVVGLTVGAGSPAVAAPDTASESRTIFPTELPLPNGFLPEGIAIGSAPFAYFGSRRDGSIYRANLVTGEGRIISAGPGTPSVGLKIDRVGRLFVSGGPAGNARVVNARNGAVLASYQFTTGTTFVNDTVLALGAAWFTDSMNQVLYKVPLGRSGRLPAPDEVVHLPLSGDMVPVPGFNVNGIAPTPDGRALLVIQSSTGLLFRVDPATGVTRSVDLGGELLTNGDGLLLDGRTLYVVQNRLNTVAVVRLDRSASAGRIVQRITDPRFDVPTTVAKFGNRLYLPNARFTTPPEPTTPYNVVAVRLG